jgi:hypothetical protein
MSVKSNAASGYLIEATKLLPLLPSEVQNEYDQYVADHDFAEAMGILDRHLPEMFPMPEEIFILGHDDDGEEMERELPYARFDEGVLYERQPTPKLLSMRRQAGNPGYYRWTVWG